MMTEDNRPGVEVPESDWNEQVIDATEVDADRLDALAPLPFK
ncbi:hypothetical protein [Brevibacterium aurantiacum]|nr:hypothetical protein [Brevibacterium aurantiacum]